MTDILRPLGDTGLDVHPLCLGGNVWGWTADKETSFSVLDAYVAAGGNFLDTADSYSKWVPGHRGGESETIIGEWLASRGRRDDLVIATKVFGHTDYPGLRRDNIIAACDASLQRLQTDHIDVYFAHRDDQSVPLEETLGAFAELIQAGKVRTIGASNYSAPRLAEALRLSAREGLPAYRVSQDQYNLVERGYETELRPVVEEFGLAETPFYGLASGFLTGKHRGEPATDGGRSGEAGGPLRDRATGYWNDRGRAVLGTLDDIAAARGQSVATVALAWLAARPTIGAVIASARLTSQLPALLAVSDLTLTAEEISRLDAASA